MPIIYKEVLDLSQNDINSIILFTLNFDEFDFFRIHHANFS